jgi:hypothetical protein
MHILKTFKKIGVKNARLTWQEVKNDGTISTRSYSCSAKEADWHLMQMRKSPNLRNIKMEKL